MVGQVGTGWLRYRTVIEEPAASESIDALKRKHERFPELWEGFVWLVARHAENISAKNNVNGIEYHLSHRSGDNRYGIPELSVIYTFDENTVTIIDVASWDAADDE